MTTLTYERHKGHASGYDVVALGYNYRTDEIHSAIGLCQLKKIDALNEKRRTVYRWYVEALADNKNIIVPFADRDVQLATCHIMPVIIKENYAENKNKLTKARIQSSKHYDLITMFTAFRQPFESKVSDLQNILTLPLSPIMTREQVQEIASILKEHRAIELGS